MVSDDGFAQLRHDNVRSAEFETVVNIFVVKFPWPRRTEVARTGAVITVYFHEIKHV